MLNYLKNIYHYILAWVGSVLYWFPSREIFVLGVTGTKGKSTTVELINEILEAAGKKTAMISSLRFKIGDQSIKNLSSNTMPGRFLNNFNLENVAAAAAFAKARDIDWQVIKKVLSKFDGIPGRLEEIQNHPFRVMIDYAHTPDSLEKVYEALSASQKLICVLGAAGGGRDKWKRPGMGKIAAE